MLLPLYLCTNPPSRDNHSSARAHGGSPRRATTGTNGATVRDDLEDLFVADEDEVLEDAAGVKDDPDVAAGWDDEDDDEEFAERHEGEPCDFAEGQKLPPPEIITQTLTAIVGQYIPSDTLSYHV